jgi:AsmA protein
MKRLIALALVVAGLIAAAIAAAPFIAATDFAKQKIAAQIAEWTGHAVSFTGEPRVNLFPFLSLTIENAHIGGPDDAAGKPFVSMDRLTCKLRLLPFLFGQVDVAEFQLIRPHFRLAIAPDGRPSWLIERNAATATAADAAPRTSTPSDSERLAETKLGRFNIIDGTVTYDDARNGRHEEFSEVGARLVWPRGKDPVAGSGALLWRGETVEFNVAVDKPLDLLAGGTSPARFALASRPLRFSFTGTMDTTAVARMEGPATVSTPSVRRVFQWLGMKTGEGAILGAGLIEGPLSWQGQKASFKAAQLELDGNIARGSFAADFSQQRPRIDAALTLERLDLTAYLESLQAIGADETWPSVPALLPLLDLADADIGIAADDVLIGTARLGAGKASISIGENGIALKAVEAQLYGGRVRADAELEAHGDALQGKAEIEIEHVLVGAVLDQLGLPRSVDGHLKATAGVTIEGKTLEEIVKSATGAARIEIVDGAIEGVELGQFAALSGASGVSDPAAGSGNIPFKALRGSVTLGDATLNSDDIHITGKTFDATLSTKLNLATSLVQAHGTLEVERERKPHERRSVPFVVGGSWSGPVLLPDFERLLQGYSDEKRPSPAGESSLDYDQPKG